MTLRGPFAAVLLLACASGCYSKVTAQSGNFTFAYASMVEHENFVKPIAPGAKLEVLAFRNGTEDKLTVKAARSSKPSVVAIKSVKDKSIIVEGVEPGIAEIEITAREDDGREIVDKMFFHVAKPTKHKLEHACTEKADAVYVRGEDVVLYHSLATAEGRPVIGFDYAPMKIEPASALKLERQPQADGWYQFRAAAKSPSVTVRSTIDDRALTLKIVDRKDLTAASLMHSPRMIQGRSSYIVAEVSAGDSTLCNQNALTKAKSLTPAICKVTGRLEDDPDGDDSNREQLARVDALAFGRCKFEVTLPELAGGKGVVLKGEIAVGREEYPGEGSSAFVDEVANKIAAGVLALVPVAWWLRRRRTKRDE